ncbi:DUF1330 domain-containing protein [Nocardia sp. CA-129566]|uniref:DUF1330 domain-containing protein n=1 Tax=Nocardia sp. CA-129566 TaxID=3239976 RepID=UPI003D97B52A
MTVYVIAQLKFTDRTAYDRYKARFLEVFARYSGTLLASDESPQVIEGDSDREKVVLMSFPDEPSFRAWAQSPEYLEISKDRHAGADTVTLLVKGIGPRSAQSS